MLSLNKLTTSA